MKLTKKQIDNLNLELTLEIAADDYSEIEKKKLAERRRTADFKGFRKGMVPASMIQRLYGDQCLAEAVNQTISTSLNEYIESNKLHILGEPMNSESQPDVEWKDGNDFTFIFDIALSPEIKLEVEKTDSVPSYNVTISAKDKTSMAESIKKYYEEKKEEKTDEEIEKEVTERLQAQFKNEAEWRLTKDIRDFYINKAGLELPEAFLKRWLLNANEGKVSKEDVEKEFPGFTQDFKWQLVRGFLMKKYELTIEDKDIQEAAMAFVSYQYAMYGLSNVPDEMIKEASVNVLHDQKQVERLVEQVEDQKVLAKLKEEMTLVPTKITSTKFKELQ